ncbi:MAG: Uma2 family endonuclease [Bythopirellula sp.]|nr:Uma2 family endonuclease [Bythopirellula sp.]
MATVSPIEAVSAVETLSSHDVVTALPITIYASDDRPAIIVPAAAATLDGFREWAISDDFPERGKITFVAGEVIVDMSPESLEEHSEIKTEICRVLAALVRGTNRGRLHIDGVLLSNKQATVSNEPDALFVAKDALSTGRIKLTPVKGRLHSSKEIVGTVDWVLEIVSPSSKRKDKVLLRKGYYDAGIPEYWLIDALDEEIDFQILVRDATEYIAVAPQDGWIASPTFGKSFKLERALDKHGFLEYTLHMK